VLLISGADDTASPVTLFPSTEGTELAESPNVYAFKAPYEQTDEGVHLSIPVAPVAIPFHTDFNLNYDNGADSNGDVGPFFDAANDRMAPDVNEQFRAERRV
jgi:hypothetical protein